MPQAQEFQIRSFRGYDEFRDCVSLQERVWGEGFVERVPPAVLWVSQRLSGVAAGAYDENGELAGFVFGLTGLENGEPVHWSDMLAVRPGLRDSGLGTRLKRYQRAVLLEKGIRKVYWSFDPLESRNAYVNLERLGAVGQEYVENMYGESESPLHRGMGTDRLIVLWELDSPRVVQLLEEGQEGSREEGYGEPAPALSASPPAGGPGGPGGPVPEVPILGMAGGPVSVAIPADIQGLKKRDLELAQRWRKATRTVLLHYLERGWEVRRLERGGPISRLVLFPVEGEDLR